MNSKDFDVRHAIERSLEKINQYPGGNKLFFKKLGKSRSLVSNWRTGKAVPSEQAVIQIMEAATKTIQECQEESNRLENRKAVLFDEFSSLVSA